MLQLEWKRLHVLRWVARWVARLSRRPDLVIACSKYFSLAPFTLRERETDRQTATAVVILRSFPHSLFYSDLFGIWLDSLDSRSVCLVFAAPVMDAGHASGAGNAPAPPERRAANSLSANAALTTRYHLVGDGQLGRELGGD